MTTAQPAAQMPLPAASGTAPKPLNIIVAGGGMAGLAAALYLRKDHTVTVIERSKLDFGAYPNDHGIAIVANAWKLLMAEGADEDRLHGALLNQLWDLTPKNELIGAESFDTRPIFGAPSIFARRSLIQAELFRLATSPERAGTVPRIIDGLAITAIDAEAGRVVCSDGQIFHGDLIVGADGIRSVARQAATDSADDSVGGICNTGLVGYMSIVPAAYFAKTPELAFMTIPGQQGIAQWSDNASNVHRVLAYPCSPEHFEVFGFAREGAWTDALDASRSSILRDIPAAAVQQDFASFAPCIRDMLTAAEISLWRIRDTKPMPASGWTKGRVCLTGDAAHAVTPHVGQGVNLAIEDAEALHYFLHGATNDVDDLQARLQLYVQCRQPRTEMVQLESRRHGGLLDGGFDRRAFAGRTYSYMGAADHHAKALQAARDGHKDEGVSLSPVRPLREQA